MIDYIAAGGNRHPAASDWHGNVLAYGTDQNIALWNPQGEGHGVTTLLTGHTDTVNAIRFLDTTNGTLLISGSVDKTVRVWKAKGSDLANAGYECIQVLEEHTSSVNCIAVVAGASIFASGGADAVVKIWQINITSAEGIAVELVQSIAIKPRFFPLALALSSLAGSSFVLAVAGTTTLAQLYVSDSTSAANVDFRLRATLTGHEGWIRCLAFTAETADPSSDLILASASQDKYIRLWRIHEGKDLPAASAAANDPAMGAFMPGKSLSNKAHRFTASGSDYSATFEALLLGHDDWIYSTRWNRTETSLQLLSASADNSLTVWEPDPSSGVWVSVARLGEISAQKGSTTATGSTGGFWTGLFSPDGTTVVCLGRTGSWRLWNYSASEDRWIPGNGISGHIKTVSGISWSEGGSYLMSTSADQTTRLHAKWLAPTSPTWHEMARPQIHGYDLNCIDTLGSTSFVSGADEKLLRVFSVPKAVADLLSSLCDITTASHASLPDAANMPVLGLSNKAIDASDADTNNPTDSAPAAFAKNPHAENQASSLAPLPLTHSHPPLEDHLSRHTLFPETEKLYGHGYEISCLASSHDGRTIATACKASSIDHAVIRLFETERWTELKPPLVAHGLTVARLRFSADDQLLLSVGRDRQWAVFERIADGAAEGPGFRVREKDPKGHSRMILDCAWVPGVNVRAFVTAGRDKSVKFWRMGSDGSGEKTVCVGTVVEEAAVTAVDFEDGVRVGGGVYMAVGTESGSLTVYEVGLDDFQVRRKVTVDRRLCPSKAITQLSWRPSEKQDGEIKSADDVRELAVASEDCSLRIYTLRGILAAST